MHIKLPTLAVCSALCLALVTAVGLQAPAASAGLRWKFGPRGTLEFIPVDPGDMAAFELGGQGDGRLPAWLIWAILALAALAVLVHLLRWLLNAMRRPHATRVVRVGADAGMTTEANANIVQSGLVAAIELLASDRPPGNAVVQAWQALEDAAAAAGLTRRPAETASEFTARILYRSQRSAGPIAVLLSLYQRVRFGEHEPSAVEIVAARDALAVLFDLWQADLPERRMHRTAR